MSNVQTYDYDVIIVGGGTAGVMTALAGAEQGLHIAVIEKNSFPGGLATGSGLTELNAAGFQGKPIYGGIEGEIFEEMIQQGKAEYHFQIPMSSDPRVKVDRLRYDPDTLKCIFSRRLSEAGVVFLGETTIEAASEDDQVCRLTVNGKKGCAELTSRYMVDATGSAGLVRALGGNVVRLARENQMIITELFRCTNVDVEALTQFILDGKVKAVVDEGLAKGILKGRILAITPIPGSQDVSVNATRAIADLEDEEDVACAVEDCKAQAEKIFPFIKEHIPAMAEAEIREYAPLPGVRDTISICAPYKLTLDDISSLRIFPDTVAWGCYPMDIHDPVTGGVVWKIIDGMYEIPWKCLLPEGFNRTLVVGKSVCAEHEAFAAIRVMPILMNMGESAGIALAMAAEDNLMLPQVDGEVLKAKLQKRYCF